MTDLLKWLPRLWILLVLLAAAQVIRALVDGARLIQAIKLHGWGG